MKKLSPTGNALTHGVFVIIKQNTNFKLGLKPIKPGAIVTFYNTGGLVPLFDGENPLQLQNGSGDLIYRVNPGTGDRTYHFNMGAIESVLTDFPYSLRVENDGSSEAALRWAETGLKVFEPIRVKGQAHINFVRGYTPEEFFDDVVNIYQGGVGYQIPKNQEDGLWVSPLLTGRTTFHFSVAGAYAKEVIGDEDADLEIIPDDGY